MTDIRFTFTEDDLVAAQRAWWTGVARWQAYLGVVLVIWLGCASVFTVAAWSGGGSPPYILIAAMVPIALCISAALFALGFVQIPRRARKAFREHKALAGEYAISVTSDTLAVRAPMGSNDLPWNVFLCWLDGPETLLLYQNRNLFNAVPKRALPPGASDDIIDHLVAAGVAELPRYGFRRSRL
ncbi:hypothetical protein WSK_1243 [Novosphingobium sp. Rr 2-17]|uniref:YcxB family protein n=1 Tax=Novosphingobium sp. Rr 2-17 TaxID=555793 RepID=UPI0002697B28|nr:YcxB family protein [Novosphingobium sp. Rr 2-17]EIZ80209.1 hypothetical protein WSK_1243 [Novosphingobium sp. Rr 2-17]